MREEIFYLENPYNMYCERIIPDKIKYKNPILMITGVAHTGSYYKYKPDGNPGWAYFFAEKGYEVYVTDWPGVGRSENVPFEKINGQFMADAFCKLIKLIDKKVILFVHSMSGPYGWKIAEKVGDKIKYLVAVAPGEMGNIQYSPETNQNNDDIEIKMPWGKILLNLKKYIKNDDSFIIDKLIGKSKLFPRKFVGQYKASLQKRHPVLTYERLNINKSQLRIKNFKNFKKTKVLIVNGTNDADHTRESKERIINFLFKNGVSSKLIWLGDYHIMGNGHMMMLEKNSDEIVELIYGLIKK